MSPEVRRLDKLVKYHRGLKAELSQLLCSPHPSAQELERARVLKKRKLRAKDRIAALAPVVVVRP